MSKGCYLNKGVLAMMSGFIFLYSFRNISKNIQVRPIDILFQACLVTFLAYQFSLKNSYHGKLWSNMLSFKSCTQTLKDANQHYAIYLPLKIATFSL